jgi:predicted nucleotidyltransferase
MSIDLLERAAAALWITDPAAPPLRPTKDVDVVVEVSTLVAYNRFEQRLRLAGFRDAGRMLGRFIHDGDLQLDAIPAEASILGFENHWQRASLGSAVERTLPSDVAIRALAPANLLATKLEAFAGRGRNDYLASPDFEDIIALLDGRQEIVVVCPRERPSLGPVPSGSVDTIRAWAPRSSSATAAVTVSGASG